MSKISNPISSEELSLMVSLADTKLGRGKVDKILKGLGYSRASVQQATEGFHGSRSMMLESLAAG